MKILWIILLAGLCVAPALARHTDCERPPHVPHSKNSYLDENDDFIAVRYDCNKGYRLLGDQTLQCSLDSDEWLQEPPTCEPVEHQIASESEDFPALAGHDKTDNNNADSDGNNEANNITIGDSYSGAGGNAKSKKKEEEILEELLITSQFAKQLDLSCMESTLTRAENIENGFIVKYNRRKKDGNIFLVAFYECDDNFELEDSNTDRLYCSQQKWIGNRPVCMAMDNEYDDNDNDNEDDGPYEEDYDANHKSEREREEERERVAERQREEQREREEDRRIREYERQQELELQRREEQRRRYEQEEEEERDRLQREREHQERERQREENEDEVDEGGEYDPEEEEREGEDEAEEDEKEETEVPEQNQHENEIDQGSQRYNSSCGPDNGGCDHNCILIHASHNSEPIVHCSCKKGFTLDPNNGKICSDIDECQLNNGGCEQLCTNLPGSFQCVCNTGFQIDKITHKTCLDINECDDPHIESLCQNGCENTEGSYRCLATDHEDENINDIGKNIQITPFGDDCPDGYQRSPVTNECADIDECAIETNGCEFCKNIPGGFECTCPEGYELADDEKRCLDTNECEFYSSYEYDDDITDDKPGHKTCSHECLNLPGSYLCKCPENFHLNVDRRTCVRDFCDDLLNLQLNKIRCSHSCIDNAEGFVCQCPASLRLNTDGKTCFDDSSSQQKTHDFCTDGGGNVHCQPGVCVNNPAEEGYLCQCPSGYAEIGGRCHNIDECQAGTHGCSHKCIDNEGSYECSCPPGYFLSANDFKTCEDTNECLAADVKVCNDPLKCVNLPGSYRCECPEGQELLQHGGCGVLDACAVANGGCSHTCMSRHGYAECQCPAGMSLGNDGRTCGTSDPCARNNYGCSQICDAKVRGYCACRDGYHLSEDGKTCLDIDECLDNNGGCSQNCQNSQGSYECVCSEGFRKSNSFCMDVNECALGLHNCSEIQECINVEGSFQCLCPRGYVSDPILGYCKDIDECFIANGNCSHICSNTPGGYHCLCPHNMKIDHTNHTCHSINHCIINNGGCSHQCSFHNHITSCSCPHGYRLDNSLKNCLDIDECSEIRNGGCSHFCTNIVGGYFCSCPAGYRLSKSDNKACMDIDECAHNNGNCSHVCMNLLGSYSCGCKEGYSLGQDVKSCVDKDECAEGDHECSHWCINVEGSYKCLCPQGYEIAQDSYTCKDVNECELQLNGGCSHLCQNSEGSFTCGCPFDHVLSTDNRTCVVASNCRTDGLRCSHGCSDLSGGFVCTCPEGLTLSSSDRFTCQNIDPCASAGCSYSCDPLGRNFKCRCPPGWQLDSDSRTCLPTKDDRIPVTENSVLQSQPNCDPGFFLDPRDNRTCQDIDECRYKNPCQQLCFNTIGSFGCRCHPGYTLDAGGSCQDINECEYANGGCSRLATCVNLPGGHKCVCNPGFKLAADKRTCLEIKDNCRPLPPIRNGEMRCFRSRHKVHLFYRRICRISCHRGYRLEGPETRHCDGTGQWDNYESSCVSQSCSRLPIPQHGTILPNTCLTANSMSGERCTLHCSPGYKPVSSRVAVCNADYTWTNGNTSLTCLPVNSQPDNVRPFIKCPENTVIILEKEQKFVHIRMAKPTTNVDFSKYVDSHPEWAKKLEVDLNAGTYVMTFRARSPYSNLSAVCTTVVTVKESKPPSVVYCPTSIDVQLRQHEVSRPVTWKEPIFQSPQELKQVFKSKFPGERFTPGVHSIVYVATDQDGQSSKCDFKIIVRAYQAPEVMSTYQANRLENHDSYVMCPGKEAMKIETNYPVQVPVGCYIKNVLLNPRAAFQRRQQIHRINNNNVFRHYTSWDNLNLQRSPIINKRHNRVLY